MKQRNIKFLLALLVSMLGSEASAHDLAVRNGDGKTIYYNYINNNELAVCYRAYSYDTYTDRYSGDLVIPDSHFINGKFYFVTRIMACAFQGCSGLTSITIPNSVTSIGEYAFKNCSSLKELTISSGTLTLAFSSSDASDTFSGCPIETLTLGRDFTYKGSSPFKNKTTIKSVLIGGNKTSIESSAFYGCSGLTSITIPNSVTSIGNSAFSDCSGLTSITIPNSVTSIGNSAFDGCSGLTSITIPNSVTSIGQWAFEHCTSLTSIIVEGGNSNYDSRDNCNAIIDKASNKLIAGCKTTTIPKSVTSIGDYAFRYCSGLASIDIPNSVTSIGDYAFWGCCGLTSIDIPNSVTSIGRSAFNDCSGLTSVTIPNSVTSIGDYSFQGCSSLESVTIGSGVLSIGSDVFSDHRPSKVIWLTNTPPSGYTAAAGEVNYVANDQYTSLSNKTVYPLLSSTFEVDGIKYVPVSMSERTCDAIDCAYDETTRDIHLLPSVSYRGVELAVNDFKPYLFYNNNFVETVSIEAPTQSIHTRTFQGCSSLKGISIPNSVATIEDYVFAGCTSMKTFQIEDRDKEITLGSNGSEPLFADCPLDYVYIGGNITYNLASNKGYSPFYGNTTLREVVITDKETEISANEFYGCTNLQTFVVGSGVTTFGDRAFSGCSSLKSLSFGSQLQTIGEDAFFGTSITEINSLAATPPVCVTNVLNAINKWECTVYVPKNSLADYLAADQWKDFIYLNGDSGSGETPDVDSNVLVISEAGIATYCPTVDVDFTTLTDVEAYIASGFNRKTGALTMTRVYDVPASTGLVVKGPAGIHEVPQSPSASIYSNMLRGSTIDRNLSATVGSYVNYVLGSIGDKVGFCLVPAEGMTLAAGHAYLTMPGETAASRSELSLCFDDEEEATGINASLTDSEERIVNSVVYDLQGRRVERPRSGLYIRGGKKVIIK